MTTLGIDCTSAKGLIGTEPCFVDPGPLLGHIVLTDRQTFPMETTTPNKAFFENLIQQGKAYFIVDAFGSPVETPAPTTETSDITQRQVVVNRGLPVVTVTLKKPYEFHKGFYTLSSQDQYSVILVYQNALRVAFSADGTSWGGFNVGMYEVLTYQESTGSTKAQSQVMYQITDLEGYNTRGMYLTGLNFNPNTDINNVTDLKMTATADASDNTIVVKAVWAANPKYNVLGLAASNFRLLVEGVADTIVSAVYDNDLAAYIITPTATLGAGDVVQVITYDAGATPAVAVAKVGTSKVKFYKGDTGSVSVTA